MPAASATTFLRAPHNSTPTTSLLVYTRKVGPLRIACSVVAVAASELATTAAVGNAHGPPPRRASARRAPPRGPGGSSVARSRSPQTGVAGCPVRGPWCREPRPCRRGDAGRHTGPGRAARPRSGPARLPGSRLLLRPGSAVGWIASGRSTPARYVSLTAIGSQSRGLLGSARPEAHGMAVACEHDGQRGAPAASVEDCYLAQCPVPQCRHRWRAIPHS